MAANLELVIKAHDQATGVLSSVEKRAGGVGHALGNVMKVGAIAGVAALGGLAVAGVVAVKSLARIEQIGAQTDAAIKSTGGAANVTREQIDELAGTLENLTSIEAETITEGQNLLLTFKNIQNRAGAGNNIFDQATEAMVNMSVAMGQDVSQTAIQMGKALNDPVLGVTALRRVGVQLTEQQEAQIKTMVAAGDVMGAQKVILGELESQFGGSAEALGKTFGGQLKIVQHQLGTVAETIFAGLMPALLAGTKLLNEGLGKAIPFVSEQIGELAFGLSLITAGFKEGDVTSSGFHGTLETVGATLREIFDVVKPLVLLFGAALTGNLQKAHTEFIKLPPSLHGVAQAVFEVGSFIRNDLVPFIIKDLLPALRDMGKFILTDVRPHVMEFGRIMKDIIAGTIKQFIVPALITLKQGWDDIWPTLKADVIPVLKEVGKFLLEHKPIIIGVAAAILLITNPWLAVVAVLIIVLAKWDEIKEMLTVTIPDAINSVIDTIKGIPIIGEIFEGTLKAVAIIVSTYFELIKIQVETAIKAVQAIIEIVLGIIHGDFGRVWQGIKDLVGALLGGLVAQARVLMDALKNLVFIALQALVGIWRDQFVLARDTVLGILGGLPGQIAGIAVSVANAAYELGASIPKRIGQAMHEFAGFMKTPLNILIGAFESAINFIIRAINKFNPASAIGGVFNKVSGMFGGPQLPSFNIPEVSLPRLHQGTAFFAGGSAITRADEMVVLPRGARVLSPTQTAAAMGGGMTLVVNYSPMYSSASPAEAERFGQFLEGILRRRLR